MVYKILICGAIAHSPKCEQVRYIRFKEDLRYAVLLRQVGSLTGKFQFSFLWYVDITTTGIALRVPYI